MDPDFSWAIQLAEEAECETGRVCELMKRPEEGSHIPVKSLYLDPVEGIQEDRWSETSWLRLPNGKPDPRVQVSINNINVMRVFTGSAPDSIFRCGDNLYVDFNLTELNLPSGTLLKVGTATLEVSDIQNDACGKFADRFGTEAFQFVRHPENLPYRLRGIFCSILLSGVVNVGDSIVKLSKFS
ncbi:MAG: hypothetical protein AAF546_00370 [Verrucomicrobiota bacterium]